MIYTEYVKILAMDSSRHVLRILMVKRGKSLDKGQFKTNLSQRGIYLTEKQMKQFEAYYQMLINWNKKMNLTAITDEKEVYLKHFYDSISAAFFVDFEKKISLCDVGAGAGFPSIPLKICFPHLKISVVDSLGKRVLFLNELARELGLTDTHFYHNRAEAFGQDKQYRAHFDIVTARAVAKMNVLAELCLPLVKKGGIFLVMKASQAKQELESAKTAVTLLGGKIAEHFSFQLPLECSERRIYTVKKTKETPNKYPRRPGLPNKQPLE